MTRALFECRGGVVTLFGGHGAVMQPAANCEDAELLACEPSKKELHTKARATCSTQAVQEAFKDAQTTEVKLHRAHANSLIGLRYRYDSK